MKVTAVDDVKKKAIQQHLFGPDSEIEPMPWETAADDDCLVAQVVLNRPVRTVYHYVVPNDLADLITPGQRVEVPFGRGNRATIGYCVGVNPAEPSQSRRLKPLTGILDREPLVSAKMLELTRWIADRYLCGWGQVLNSVIPGGVKKKAGTRLVQFFRVAPDSATALDSRKLPPKQAAVLQRLQTAGAPLRIEEITEVVGCGPGPVKALRDKGLIQAIRQRAETRNALPDVDVPQEPDLTLNHDQQVALDGILDQIRSGQHATILLHGVTGSGKTEVYIQAIREVVSYGRQVILLVPEISLTPQTIRRFRSRFSSVAVLHSHLSDAERHWQWQQIARGGVQVIVGARSAVFAPTPHLGMIVIDEEHETTFKQETTPRYHAREVARQRAEMENVPLILGTATPTLESWLRVHRKQDRLISLPRRVEGLPLPPVVIVDVRNDPHVSRGAAIGRALRNGIQTSLNDGGQVILFLNLRGFSPAVWCVNCRSGIKCPSCDITLTWHKDRNAVLCHFCDYAAERPPQCPTCGHRALRYIGIGTQKLEEEVRSLFPSARCLRMDSDSMRKPGSHNEALEAFRHGKVHILLGTQMIAKGLDFPNVTLVGVVDADTMLHQPDIRAAERTFQLIAQVAGRTGRSTRGGRVLVQTSSPEEPSILFAARHDFAGFARQELLTRREMEAPPFHHLARVILRGKVEPRVKEAAKTLTDHLRCVGTELNSPVRILGPAPTPVAKQRDYYRYHLRLSAVTLEAVHDLWLAASDSMASVRDAEYTIDVDAIDCR